MNQILSTDISGNKKKNKNSKPIEINNIVKFFAIAIIIFGIFIIGIGAYSIIDYQKEQQEENIEPTIQIENKTNNSIILKVTHKKNIESLEYGWNDEEKVFVNGNNGRYLEKEITIPSGTNTLHVIIRDEYGKEITYEKQYEIEININIEIS